MPDRKINILDKIGRFIPGYSGYAIRNEKRNTDHKLKYHIAATLQKAEEPIQEIINGLIKNNLIQDAQQWEHTRKAVNTLQGKVKSMPYGESAFFSEQQLKEEELDKIYQFDLEIAERADILMNAINNYSTDTISTVTVVSQVKEIDEILFKRTEYLKSFK